ncbi:putative peptidoglycan glycosyltransferase FtsW [Azospirillum sp. SYSU D00513]|uniref:FtsW/RodA/SpoVE family cell cycle protein n=1 Tax=Azospirillum sp. SYSU D00513 TaxID=2812561 RepID=UPI001A971B64|nr:putative peptidoglycan glycosyltransferase FtsW [Azospirillum sp. SYSU D00513]
MVTFDRTDQSVFGRWWWTVDRWQLAALGALILIGTVLITAASPPVAERIGISDTFYFVERHLMMLVPSLAIMGAVSMLSPRGVRRVALAVFLVSVALVFATLVVGVEIKGARRWIHIPGLSIQPSEFVKPAFAVVAAWLFSLSHTSPGFPGWLVSMALYGLTVAGLILQPDLGMTFVVSAVWFSQFFLAGLNIMLVAILGALGVAGLIGAYYTLPHVQSRIDRFLDPASGDTYQVSRSLEAFANGGLLGTGPGQGTVKFSLPDSHADFIFAVAGEEMGLLFCLFIVAIFAFIVLRGFARVFNDTNYFIMLATAGLLIQFGLQAAINMGSALHLMPTKGMTLPFISYGGSSLLALGFGMGMVLALTRKRFGPAV